MLIDLMTAGRLNIVVGVNRTVPNVVQFLCTHFPIVKTMAMKHMTTVDSTIALDIHSINTFY